MYLLTKIIWSQPLHCSKIELVKPIHYEGGAVEPCTGGHVEFFLEPVGLLVIVLTQLL